MSYEDGCDDCEVCKKCTQNGVWLCDSCLDALKLSAEPRQQEPERCYPTSGRLLSASPIRATEPHQQEPTTLQRLRSTVQRFIDGTPSPVKAHGPGMHRRAAERREVETIHRTLNVVLHEIDQLEATEPRQQEPILEPDQIQLLAWAVTNSHTLARRALAHTTSVYDREKWEHVLRICEKAGARSQGVLRAALPTEITEGEATEPRPPADLWQRIYDAAANEGSILHDDTVTAIANALEAPRPPAAAVDLLDIPRMKAAVESGNYHHREDWEAAVQVLIAEVERLRAALAARPEPAAAVDLNEFRRELLDKMEVYRSASLNTSLNRGIVQQQCLDFMTEWVRAALAAPREDQ